MGRKKGLPTCIIPIREKVAIKKLVIEYAKQTGISVQEAYKRMIKQGRI